MTNEHKVFRNVLCLLAKLRTTQLPIPFVLLSATAPPQAVPELKETYACFDLEEVRDETERMNLCYKVEPVDTCNDILGQVIEFVTN